MRLRFWRRKPQPSERPLLADEALAKLIADYAFDTVLDIGCGTGRHTQLLRAAGKQVTPLDYRPQFAGVIVANYLEHTFAAPFDCIWASHVLEHQPNVHWFLRKLFTDLKTGGVLAVTVPPAKPEIVGGHLTLWNPGLLLYNLVLAGFDCRDAAVKQYGYNVSVITPKVAADLPTSALRFANGDIEQLADFFPRTGQFRWRQSFAGDFRQLNWDRRAA